MKSLFDLSNSLGVTEAEILAAPPVSIADEQRRQIFAALQHGAECVTVRCFGRDIYRVWADGKVEHPPFPNVIISRHAAADRAHRDLEHRATGAIGVQWFDPTDDGATA